MKKLILSFAFILMAMGVFANTHEVVAPKIVTTEVASKNHFVMGCSLSYNGRQLSQNELLEMKDCTIRGKFKLTFSDGQTINWEGTLTIVGQSCAELLKSLK